MGKKKTAPHEWEAVLRQKYAKRICFPVDRPVMPSQTNGLKLSVNTLRKLDAQRPKHTKCYSPARLHLSRRTRGFLKNYANEDCLFTLHFEFVT